MTTIHHRYTPTDGRTDGQTTHGGNIYRALHYVCRL